MSSIVADVCTKKGRNRFARSLSHIHTYEQTNKHQGKANAETDWNNAAELITNHILKNHPEYKVQSGMCWWSCERLVIALEGLHIVLSFPFIYLFGE